MKRRVAGSHRSIDRPSRYLTGVTLAVAVLVGGCGDDSSQDGVGADSTLEPAGCSPVGEDLAARAAQNVPIELKEFSFQPMSVRAPAGIVTFAANNTGKENHEVAFLPGGGEVPVKSGAPDEDALGQAGAFELEAFGPGKTCNATYDLRPGTYSLFCIVESPDGRTHYEKGMRGQLVVG